MILFRDSEIKKLNDFCDNPRHKAMAIYGRRRTGKTALVLEFARKEKKRKCIYFQCASFDYSACLTDFTAAIQSQLEGDTVLGSLTSFRDVFTYLDRISTEGLVIIIDEFPFLSKKNSDTVIEFQWIIDHSLSRIKLILLGSNLSFMRKQLGDAEAPLYGRFDEIIEIRPFLFSQVRELFPDFEEAVSVYAMTGGVAQYVMFFKDYSSVKEAEDHLFFDRNGRLFLEASNLLLQEVRDTSKYAAILRAISGSEKDSGQIATRAGMDQRGVFAYLKKLIDLEIVETVENPLSHKKRETRYRISDMLFRFNYTFIEPNISMITALGSRSKQHILGDLYKEYLGFVYEDLIRSSCFEYAEDGRLPFMPMTIGKWWGNVSLDGAWQESEIDVIAFNNDQLLAGECKYRRKAVGINELDLLKAKAGFLPSKGRRMHYLLASRSGFTDALKRRAAESEDVTLIEKI